MPEMWDKAIKLTNMLQDSSKSYEEVQQISRDIQDHLYALDHALESVDALDTTADNPSSPTSTLDSSTPLSPKRMRVRKIHNVK